MINDILNYDAEKTLDDYLNTVDFSMLGSDSTYVPSTFALQFMNMINLINTNEGDDEDEKGEEHKTPVMHLIMLDQLISPNKRLANLCARGVAKTTLFFEYLSIFLSLFKLPNFGKVSGMIYVSDSMDNGVKSARESVETRYNNSEYLKYWIPEASFTEKFIQFKNRAGQRLGIKMFGAKTGIRGSKIYGKRPSIAVMDDLVSDADSKSPTAMSKIRDTVYSSVQFALHPTKFKMILNGTPFNKEDIVVQAIESGAWTVNVWPVCEKFPCPKEEFKGAWPDRFPYEYVKEQYDFAIKNGTLNSFRQELMLRITSPESRLVQDNEIRWSRRQFILQNKHLFNFYITTDFATSSKQTADFSVISVWAYDADKNWHWVDGVCERQTMNKTVNDLFRLVTEYKPEDVGIETSGQQGGFIDWIMKEMQNRNVYFNLAREKGKIDPGIRPVTDKLSRFNLVVPKFKAGKIYLPYELKTSKIIGILLDQITLVTKDGIKGKDDFLDTVSMLEYLSPWEPNINTPKPTQEIPMELQPLFGTTGLVTNDTTQEDAYSSYVV